MNDLAQERARKKKRQQSISISDEMINDIAKATKGCISVSGYVRLAIIEKLERQKIEESRQNAQNSPKVGNI